jgi:hypothetical protein
MDDASAAHPKKWVAVARSVVLFWTFTMSNSNSRTDLGLARDRQFSMRRSGKPDLRAPFTRARNAPRACTEIRFDRRAAANADARAPARVVSVGQLGI